MEAIRQIITSPDDHITVPIPERFKNRALEIIVMPTDVGITPLVTNVWPEDFLSLAGTMPNLIEPESEGPFDHHQAL